MRRGARDESDAAGGDLFPLKAGASHERADPRALRLGQQREAAPHEHPVLTAERCHIGNGRERDEIEHVEHDVLVAAHHPRQLECELERDSNRREVLVR